MRPFSQGDFSNECGVYSLVNAIHYLCGPLRYQQAYSAYLGIVEYLSSTQKLELHQHNGGVTLPAAAACLKHWICQRYPIHRRKPFRSNADIGLDHWWCAAQEFLRTHNGVILIGLAGALDHWTLVHKVSDKALHLFDSSQHRSLRRNSCCTWAEDPEEERHRHVIYPTYTYFLWTDRDLSSSIPGQSRRGHAYPRPRLPRIASESLDAYLAELLPEPHNEHGAGQSARSVQEERTCKSAHHGETRTGFMNGRTLPFTGCRTLTPAASELEALLASVNRSQDAKKPKRC